MQPGVTSISPKSGLHGEVVIHDIKTTKHCGISLTFTLIPPPPPSILSLGDMSLTLSNGGGKGNQNPKFYLLNFKLQSLDLKERYEDFGIKYLKNWLCLLLTNAALFQFLFAAGARWRS